MNIMLVERAWLGLVGNAFLNWCLISSNQITIENLHKIEAGMSVAQVERILGTRPGNHSYGGVPEYFGDAKIDPKTHREWVGDQISIVIFLDKDGKVRGRGIGLTTYKACSIGAFRSEFRLRLRVERRILF